MIDELIAAAGTAPARGQAARWRQVALLATAAALGGGERAHRDLAAAFQALDHPRAAIAAADGAGDSPWIDWWRLLAEGQIDPGGVGPRAEALARAPRRGPDAREVRRRLADLAAEVAALSGAAGEEADDARFAVLGAADGPPRRVLLGGRSSATYLVEPGWEAVRLIRLGPSEGPAGGNRAHHTLAAAVEMLRRGERGADRDVPGDAPPVFDALDLLEGLREGRAARDQRLLDLADEVREERARLGEARATLQADRAALRHALRQVQELRDRGGGVAPALPETREDAAALLEVDPAAGPAEVERAWKRQVVRCHPDRVSELHPAIRGQAEGLTVALNAARDMLVGTGAGVRRRGR